MKHKTLKELNDMRNNPKKSESERQAAQIEWDKRHKEMFEQQQKEQIEKGLENESNSIFAVVTGNDTGRGVMCGVLSGGGMTWEDFATQNTDKSLDWLRGAAVAWQHRQNEVDQLNDCLNAMEQCYIAMKKERDDLLTKAKTVVNNYKQLKAKVDTSTPQVIIDAERRGTPCL